MKKLLVTLFILGAMFIPKPVLSDDSAKEWSAGDIVLTASICKSEEVIMDVARQDTVSEEATIARIIFLSQKGDCFLLRPPAYFQVHSIVVSYKDYLKRPSVVLALRIPQDPEVIIGYAIAMGNVGAI